MAGRKPNLIKDENGRALIAHIGNHAIRVGKDKTNNKYVLFKDSERLLGRKQLRDITEEFDKLVSKDNLITIPPEKLKTVESKTFLVHKRISIQGDNIFFHEISDAERKELEERYEKNPNDKIFINYLCGRHVGKDQKLPIEAVIKLFVDLLKKDKYKVASIAKMPILAKLDEIDPSIFRNSITITLDDILDAYINRVKDQLSSKSKKDADNWLNELKKIIKFKTGKKIQYISEFSKDNILKYSEEIYRVSANSEYKYKCKWLSPIQIAFLDRNNKYPKKKWYRDRVSMLITLFNNYLKVNMLSDEPEALIIKVIMDRLRNIQHFGKQKPRPKKMDIEDLQKLFKAGDLRWKCFLALAINCSYTLIDICNLRKSDLFVDKKYIEKDREKTDEYRCAYLHDLTIKLLKKYFALNTDNNTDFVFINRNGNQLNAQTLRDLFSDLRIKAGVDKNVKFNTTTPFRFSKCNNV